MREDARREKRRQSLRLRASPTEEIRQESPDAAFARRRRRCAHAAVNAGPPRAAARIGRDGEDDIRLLQARRIRGLKRWRRAERVWRSRYERGCTCCVVKGRSSSGRRVERAAGARRDVHLGVDSGLGHALALLCVDRVGKGVAEGREVGDGDVRDRRGRFGRRWTRCALEWPTVRAARRRRAVEESERRRARRLCSRLAQRQAEHAICRCEQRTCASGGGPAIFRQTPLVTLEACHGRQRRDRQVRRASSAVVDGRSLRAGAARSIAQGRPR